MSFSPGRAILTFGLCLLALHLIASEGLRKPGGRVVFGDATHHFVQLRSAVFDHDWDFKNDYMTVYGVARAEDGPEWLTSDLTPTGRVRNYMPVGPAVDRKSTRLNSSHVSESRMPSSA